jgi:hypothetical protein
MSSQPKIHTELLQRQLGELFKAVNDRGIHRSKFNDFKPLVVNDVEGITYTHDFVDASKQRSRATIQVLVGPRRFLFNQNYNFGVMLSQETLMMLKEDSLDRNPHVLLEYLTDETVDEELRKTTMIEFEYAISLATESIATNLANLG